jgi:hypothetical protein
MQTHLPPIQFSIPLWRYFLYCFLATVGLRILFFFFRASAVTRGDFPGSERQPGVGWTFWQAFWECFRGYSQHRAHADFLLNAYIGFFELAAYPVLLKTENYSIIGGWLVIRTAGNWSGWSVSRTSFNRYLLNIILELALAYFVLSHFVQVSSGTSGVFSFWPGF